MIRRLAFVGLAALTWALLVAPLASAQQAPAAGAVADEAPGPTLNAVQAARAKELGKRVKCMCGGCNDAAGLCYHSGGTFSGPCPMALAMLKKIDTQVANGESDDAILKSFVQEYGPTVLIEPPKSGFNLTAWIMPIAVPLVAFFAVWEVVRRWRHRAALTPTAGPGAPAVPHDLLDRVRADADKDDA
jgi:cytochrome c-type biogenesis protein CcmH/NrfF